MIKAAIVGIGHIAKLHFLSLKKMGIDIIGVVDSNLKKWEEVKKHWHIDRCYASLKELLSENSVDVVHICTPPQSHYAIALDALSAGCNLIIEKPITLSFKEAKHLFDLAQQKHVRIFQVENFLFHPCVLRARQLIDTDEFGQVKYIHIYWRIPTYLKGEIPQWMKNLPGKQFAEVCMHPIYIALAFVKGSINKAHVNILADNYHNIDTLTILLQSAFTMGVITLSKKMTNPAIINIMSEKATISINVENNSFIMQKNYTDNLYSKFALNITTSVQLLGSLFSTALSYILGKFKEGYHFNFINSVYNAIIKGYQGPIGVDHILSSIRIYEMALLEMYRAENPNRYYDSEL
jgi:predicted dehydrogenase